MGEPRGAVDQSLIGKARLTGLAFVHCHGRTYSLFDGDGGG